MTERIGEGGRAILQVWLGLKVLFPWSCTVVPPSLVVSS